MARISLPMQCVLAAAGEAFMTVQLFPQYLPAVKPWTWIFARLAALNLGLWALWIWQIYPRFQSPLRHLPRPKGGYFVIGHGHVPFLQPPAGRFVEWIRTIPNDGLIHFRSFWNQDRLFITKPQMLSEILVARSYEFVKPDPLREQLSRVLGSGLVTVEGDEHRFQRKHIMPVFSFRHIKNLYPMMWDKAVELTKCVAAELNANPDESSSGDQKGLQGVIEVHQWANKATMDVIGVAGLGREFNALRNANDELMETYDQVLEPSLEKATYFALNIIFPPWLIKLLPWKLNEIIRVTTENLHRICLELVRSKKLALEKGEEHIDILSTLIKSNDFSDEGLCDQLLTFLAAGHDTTSATFSWTLYMLATHPEIQAKLRSEIRAALPSNPSSNPAALSSLSEILESLPYLNAVCSETQRLYPAVPMNLRIASRDSFLGDVRVPKGTQCFISALAVNRSFDLWGAGADDFIPERWIDDKDGEKRPNNTGGIQNNYSYLTFLHGPRSCIGQGFARAEVRVLVAAWVGAFEFEMKDPNEEVPMAGVVTMKPKNGLHLRVRSVGVW